jgi:hypothetical protein
MKSIIIGATILSALAIAGAAHATPINYSFTVTANSGPLSGDTATGTFSYDSSSIVPGGANGSVGLLTSLNFTWNGITYDQTTANTGFLRFDSAGNLTVVSFGNDCAIFTCGASPNTNDWFVSNPDFVYATPTGGPANFGGTATLSLIPTVVPEPSSLALLGVGAAGVMLIGARGLARDRRAAIAD